MKKTLLSCCLLIGATTLAQPTPSPDWTTIQNTNFPRINSTVKFLDAVDANVVWTTGRGRFSRNDNWYSVTTDGGATFKFGDISPTLDTNTYVIGSIIGINASTAWITGWYKVGGNKGFIYKTTNGGTTWVNGNGGNNAMFSNAASFANFTCFTDATTGITAGDPINNVFEIYRTTDNGTTWTAVPGANIPPSIGAEFGQNDGFATFGSHIWFGTSTNRVYHSIDAGLNWTVGAIAGATQGVPKVAFKDANNGLAYAYSGTPTNLVFGVYKTTDGGANWTDITYNSANIGKTDICVIPGANSYAAVGSASNNAVVSYSKNDGATWTNWGSSNIQYFNIDFVDANTGWAGVFSSSVTPVTGGIVKYAGNVFTGLKSLAPIFEASINPNPTSGIVNISLPLAKHGMVLNIMDGLGKIVYSENISSYTINETKQLNLDFLAKGLYTINFNIEGNTSYSKIVIQ